MPSLEFSGLLTFFCLLGVKSVRTGAYTSHYHKAGFDKYVSLCYKNFCPDIEPCPPQELCIGDRSHACFHPTHAHLFSCARLCFKAVCNRLCRHCLLLMPRPSFLLIPVLFSQLFHRHLFSLGTHLREELLGQRADISSFLKSLQDFPLKQL